jgi:SAM-dependent methyltransferase
MTRFINRLRQLFTPGGSAAACPLCFAPDTVFVREHDDFSGAGIYWCGNCRYGFTRPLPTAVSLKKYYRELYRKSITFTEELKQSRALRAQAQFDFMALPPPPPNMLKLHPIIDIGCGIGSLAALLHAKGYQAIGVDQDVKAIAWGREYVYPNLVDEFDFSNPLYGICLSHVIEHFIDVKAELYQILKNTELKFIFIEVPNCTLETIRCKPTVSHLHFFSANSLKIMLNSLCITDIAISSYGQALSDYCDNIVRGKKSDYFAVHRPDGDGTILRLMAWRIPVDVPVPA